MTQKATIAAIVHGEAGAGKSYFAGTSPAPRLILDCEGGSRFVRANLPTVQWNPKTSAKPPEYDGTWNSVTVAVTDWDTLVRVYNVLASGNHPFESVVLDSLTEAQKRLIDNVSGTDQPTQQQWGEVLRYLEDLVRRFRDLTFHTKKPVNVIMTCLSHFRDDHTRPMLKGQLELSLPSFTDVVAYCYANLDQKTMGTQYSMLLAPMNNIIAKDRSGVITQKYGPVLTNANFTDWIGLVEELYADPTGMVTNPTTTNEETK